MNCTRHPNRSAVAQCRHCGAYVCKECATATKALRESEGVLCVDCYTQALNEAAANVRKKRNRRLRRIILSIIFYFIGVIVFISAIASGAEGTQFVVMIIISVILCGLYTAIAGWRAAREAHREHELKHGASYTITSSGVYRDTGFGAKLLMFLLGAAFGIIVTPISIIKNIAGMVSDKKTINMFEQEVFDVAKI